LGNIKEWNALPSCFLRSKEFSQEIFHEVGAHAIFPLKTHCQVPIGFVPMGFNPMNQTCSVGKNPQGVNPTEILRKSFESKEADLITILSLWLSMSSNKLALATRLDELLKY
jgi:hypothetical protein